MTPDSQQAVAMETDASYNCLHLKPSQLLLSSPRALHSTMAVLTKGFYSCRDCILQNCIQISNEKTSSIAVRVSTNKKNNRPQKIHQTFLQQISFLLFFQIFFSASIQMTIAIIHLLTRLFLTLLD